MNGKIFEKEMKKDYTILIPQMSPLHFQFLETALGREGYKTVMLPEVDTNAVDEGLKYINNDACYPTIVSLGQIISYLKSGELDLDKTAIFMSQTGGGCRASNYVALLRKALKDHGYASDTCCFGQLGRAGDKSRIQDHTASDQEDTDGIRLRRCLHEVPVRDETLREGARFGQ